MSFQSDTSTLSWFRANQSLLLLLNVACFTEKEQIPMLHPLVWSDLNSKLRCTTLEASTLIITPQLFFSLFIRPFIWHFSHHIPLNVMFCRSLFVLFLLAIVLSVIRFTDSDYTFGIFKLFIIFLYELIYFSDIHIKVRNVTCNYICTSSIHCLCYFL